MKCSNIHNDLIFYLDRELGDDRMEAVRKHLDGCADCRSFLEVLKQQMQLIDDEKHPEVSSYFFTRLSIRLDEKTVFAAQFSFLRNLVQPAFFSILLLAGISCGIYLGNQASAPVAKPIFANDLLLVNDFEAEPIETFLLGQK